MLSELAAEISGTCRTCFSAMETTGFCVLQGCPVFYGMRNRRQPLKTVRIEEEYDEDGKPI